MQNLLKTSSKNPIVIKVETNKKYFWCSCGFSSKQPFCDGAHKNFKNENGEIIAKPIIFEAKNDEEIYFCNCKESKKGALCDGTHLKIS